VFDRRHLIEIEQAGHCGAVREVYESSVCMGRLALEALETPADEIDDVEQTFRANDEMRLGLQIESGDLHAGDEHRFKVGDEAQRTAAAAAEA
jgi:CPA2 family monovalent cation:H+ antiporter-2